MSVVQVGLDGVWTSRAELVSPLSLCLPLPALDASLCFSPLVVLIPVAIAVAVAVAVSVGASHHHKAKLELPDPETLEQLSQLLVTDILVRFPANLLDYPVQPDFAAERGLIGRGDGCTNHTAPFGRRDGSCLPLLKRGPCPGLAWLTLDPVDLTAQCTARLCGKGRVFNGEDGLCHDVYDALECRGGRRFYYTAFGDPICDCPIGQVPFPRPSDPCVPLFTRGPCPAGQVVTATRDSLGCAPSSCQSTAALDGQPEAQWVRWASGDGRCYALGSRGPCRRSVERYAFDVFTGQAVCADVFDPLATSYGLTVEESALLDLSYGQMYPYEPGQVLVAISDREGDGVGNVFDAFDGFEDEDDEDVDDEDDDEEGEGDDADTDDGGRQDVSNVGVVQLPRAVAEVLLVPCRAGARVGNNYKCTNPLVPRARSLVQQAVRPALTCSQGLVLVASGVCRPGTAGAACGPTYQFVPSLGQCRQTLSSIG